LTRKEKKVLWGDDYEQTGKSPNFSNLPHDLYNTPNIRVITLRDFRGFCAKHGIQILREIAISSHYKATIGWPDTGFF